MATPCLCNMYIIVLSMNTRMLFSCLVDADFLDTEQALQGEKPRGGYANVKELLARLVRSVEPWLKEPKTALCARRNEILSRCLKGGDDARGLYTLTVPTGGGKTVASLAFALSHAVAQGMERVIYVIPYTSIIEQTANTFAERIGRENVLEHHSQAELGKDEEDADDVETQRRRLACENWDAPVIVTTAVQFFESLYATRTSRCRKLHNMARSVIVFDEAQTLPMPMLKPCVFAVAELVRHYGATAVLCTATQPALGKLFAAYAPEYPMREIAPDPDGLFDFFRRVTFRQEGQLTDAEVAQRLTEDERVLCVVNSRKRARAIYQMLPEEGRYHLSTLMTAQDREQTLKLVRQRLKNEETCRVVSTSLIEAGVDVDFPAVWREKAGLDSILQAAGRCNREGENALADSVVHIFSGEGNIPAEVKRRISPLEYVVANYADINTREAIAAYFGRLLWATGDAALDVEGVLFAQVTDDRIVEVIAAQRHTVGHGNLPHGQNRNVRRPCTHVHNHGAIGLVKAGARTQCRCNGALQQIGFAHACIKHGTDDGALFHIIYAGGHGNHGPGAREKTLADNLRGEVLQHCTRKLKVNHCAVAQRAQGKHVAGGAPDHAVGVHANGQGLAGITLNGYHSGFAKHNSFPFHIDQHVGGAKVDADVVHLRHYKTTLLPVEFMGQYPSYYSMKMDIRKLSGRKSKEKA